jgi:hypothetical protein
LSERDVPALILDDVENPGNAEALREVAALFGWSCLTSDELTGASPLVALENAPGAADLHGFRFPPGPRPALVVGNERRGLRPDLLARADRTVQIPMASRRLNTLNVAAAAAVALHVLSRGGGGKLRVHTDPDRHRPELLLLSPADEVELGSALRSAAAFGWSRLHLDDRLRVWFDTDRVTRSLGRGAARRGRNELKVMPARPDRALTFDEAVVVTAATGAEPLHRLNLARGPRQLVVIPDETAVDLAVEDLGRLAARVRLASLDLPSVPRRFRLTASIALAEASRQVGVGRRRGGGRERPPTYGDALQAQDGEAGQLVQLAELPA